jgi:hypothetical protein
MTAAGVVDGEALGGDGGGPVGQGCRYDLAERKRCLVGEGAVLGAGELEQAFQQPVDLVELAAEPVCQGERLRRYGLRLGDCHIQRCSHGGQWGA